jgi:hypothetical protein
MNSLSILIEQAMRLDPMDAYLYVFGNRRHDRIKILASDGNGFWVSGVFCTLRRKHEERRSPRTYRRNVAWLMTVSRTLASP